MDESGFFFVSSVKEKWGVGRPERIGGSLTGWSEVWMFERDGKFRVLKSLKPDYRGLPLYEGLLKKEFDIGSSLSHSNICQTYTFIEHPELGSCIEMEWVDGRSLEESEDECRKDPDLGRKIILEICDALIYIHSKQMVHQDLKLSNILITNNGNNVKIIDFGLSLQDSQSELKISGGTKSYAAPELLEGKKADVLSDIYSLGKVIEHISQRYGSVVKRCCKLNPADRYLSVTEVKEAILKKDKSMNWVLPLTIAVAAVLLVVLIVKYRGRDVILERVPDTATVLTEDSVNLAVQEKNIKSEKVIDTDLNKKQELAKPKTQVNAEERPSNKELIEDETDLDKLFDSVTKLFEEKEGDK